MSNLTSNFGPRVSFTTTKSDAGPIHVFVPSTGTFTAAGDAAFSGKASFDYDAIRSGSTTASLVTATMADQQLSIASVDGLAAYLTWRSGNTVYEWVSTSTSV